MDFIVVCKFLVGILWSMVNLKVKSCSSYNLGLDERVFCNFDIFVFI